MKLTLALAAAALALSACASADSQRRAEAYNRCYAVPEAQKTRCMESNIVALEAQDRTAAAANERREADAEDRQIERESMGVPSDVKP